MGKGQICPVQGFDASRIPEDFGTRKRNASLLTSDGRITEDAYALAGYLDPESLASIISDTPPEEKDAFIQRLQQQARQEGVPWERFISSTHGIDLVDRLNALLENHPNSDGLQFISYDSPTDSMIAFFKDPVNHTPRLSEPFTMNDLTGWFGLGACETGDARFALASSLALVGDTLTAESGIQVSVDSLVSHFAVDKKAYDKSPLTGEPSPFWSGKKFPTDMTTLDLQGNPMPLVPEGSTKPILVSVWASWCGYCLRERQDFNTYPSTQYDHVYLSGDESRSQSTAAIQQYGFTDEGRDLWANQAGIESLNLTGFPANIIMRPDGTILYATMGPLSPAEVQAIIDEYMP